MTEPRTPRTEAVELLAKAMHGDCPPPGQGYMRHDWPMHQYHAEEWLARSPALAAALAAPEPPADQRCPYGECEFCHDLDAKYGVGAAPEPPRADPRVAELTEALRDALLEASGGHDAGCDDNDVPGCCGLSRLLDDADLAVIRGDSRPYSGRPRGASPSMSSRSSSPEAARCGSADEGCPA